MAGYSGRTRDQQIDRLDGKAVIVAGAAQGMGRAVAERAADAGARLLLADCQYAEIVELARVLMARGVTAAAMQFDIAQLEMCAAVADRCCELYGRIDGAVTTAGVMQTKPFFDITPADLDRVLRVNLIGTFYFLQAVTARMEGGSVVLFSSTAARAPRPLSVHYAASKAGVSSITRSVAVSVAPRGIRVNAVCPGLIDTPMMDQIKRTRAALTGQTIDEVHEAMVATVPLCRFGTPQDVASVVVFLLSDHAAYLTGETIGVNGGTDGTL